MTTDLKKLADALRSIRGDISIARASLMDSVETHGTHGGWLHEEAKRLDSAQDECDAALASVAAAQRVPELESRGMLLARLENEKANGNLSITIDAVLALLNDCDYLASLAAAPPPPAAQQAAEPGETIEVHMDRKHGGLSFGPAPAWEFRTNLPEFGGWSEWRPVARPHAVELCGFSVQTNLQFMQDKAAREPEFLQVRAADQARKGG